MRYYLRWVAAAAADFPLELSLVLPKAKQTFFKKKVNTINTWIQRIRPVKLEHFWFINCYILSYDLLTFSPCVLVSNIFSAPQSKFNKQINELPRNYCKFMMVIIVDGKKKEKRRRYYEFNTD